MVDRVALPLNNIVSAGTLASDFSGALGSAWTKTTAGGGEVVQTAEVASKYGTQCIRLSNTASDSDNCVVTRTLDAAIDMTAYESIGVALYVPLEYFTAATSHAVLVYFSTNAGTFTDYYMTTLIARKPGWNFLTFKRSSISPVGSGNWASIRTLRIRMNGSAAAAKRVYLDAIVYGCRGRPKICFTFDDGSISQYTFAKAELLTYGIYGTFFSIAQEPTNFGSTGIMTVAQMQEIITDGHEGGYHGLHGSNNWMSTTPPKTAIFQSVTAMNSTATWTPVPYAAWPNGEFGQNNGNVSTALSDSANYFFANRTTQDASIAYASLTGIGELQAIPGLSLDDATTLASAKSKIDSAIALGEIRIFTFHQFAAAAGAVTWAQADFTSLCQYLAQKRAMGLCDVVKFSEVVQGCGKNIGLRPSVNRP